MNRERRIKMGGFGGFDSRMAFALFLILILLFFSDD
jgi:hypothetical protein